MVGLQNVNWWWENVTKQKIIIVHITSPAYMFLEHQESTTLNGIFWQKKIWDQ